MQNVKYISGDNFQYLENERDSSMELVLVNMGKEVCKPYHAVSAYREEYIIHFIISGTGFFSAGGRTWTLTPGQMFLIYPNEPIVYCPDKNDPWIYAWIGFRGLRADSILLRLPRSIWDALMSFSTTSPRTMPIRCIVSHCF